MNIRTGMIAAAVTLALAGGAADAAKKTTTAASKTTGRMIGVNVVLKQDVSDRILADIARYGAVRDVVPALDALTMQAREADLPKIHALPYVAAANPDAARNGAPVDGVAVADFANGFSTWDLDAVNVTNPANTRTVAQDGTGVYVAVLDTGLLDSWRLYFPQQRIASQFGIAFGGGGGEMGTVSSQPNKWEHDQDSHGSHVTSTIIGYNLRGAPINGVAPMATVIPVKVLNQSGSGWSSVIARGITYVADLKLSGKLGSSPVVINMSLGGPSLDAMEKAAIDYAIDAGVIIVASAGNSGSRGMGFPGAYSPVISVAAAGWTGQWTTPTWWTGNVPDPTNTDDFFIADFSSRELNGQHLDVAAPGDWIVGPYQVNSGQTSYYYLSGTSMSAPHVAGVAALMVQKNPGLAQADVESILKASAVPMGPGCRDVLVPGGASEHVCWDANATGAGLVTANAALDATP